MNASLKPLALVTARQWLIQATQQLRDANIPSARLDAELLLAGILGVERTWLMAHPEQVISKEARTLLEKSLGRRVGREPLAYIHGFKEFYGRRFTVTTDTLIPRPETETIIELLKQLVTGKKTLIDIGTGSGAVAVTAKLEYPTLTVSATDLSHDALAVAQDNAKALKADVDFAISDLLADTTGSYDIICANLPYVDRGWHISPETRFEPDLALYAEEDGLVLIKQLVEQAESQLLPYGYLILEADPRQHEAIIAFSHGHGFSTKKTSDFIITLQKT